MRISRRSTGQDVAFDMLYGALAGIAGTAVMGPLSKYLTKKETPEQQILEKELSPKAEPATVQVAERAADAVGQKLPEDKKSLASGLVDYGFGAFWGAVYGGLRGRVRFPLPAAGILLGVGLWMFADELAVPALKLSPPSDDFPDAVHAKGLAAHVAYGGVLDRGFAVLHGLFA